MRTHLSFRCTIDLEAINLGGDKMSRVDFGIFWKRLNEKLKDGQLIGDKRFLTIRKWVGEESNDDWSHIIKRWDEQGYESNHSTFRLMHTGDNAISKGQVLLVKSDREQPVNLSQKDLEEVYRNWEDYKKGEKGVANFENINNLPWIISILNYFGELMAL
jgi:hypothetical protein